MEQLKRKLMMTLVLLMTAATGAWAQSGENIFQYCYDCQRNPAYPKAASSATLSGFTNPYVGYKGIGSGKGNTSAGPWKMEYMGLWSTTNNYGINSVTSYQNTYNCTDVPVFRLYQWNATANEYQHAAYGVVCCYAKVSNEVEHTALFVAEGGWGCVLTNSSHSTSMNIIFDEDLKTGLTTLIAGATPGITFTRGTGEHSNEWTMDGGMPGGNVLVTVTYKTPTTMALTFGGADIPADGVTGFLGFEQEFIDALAMAVKTNPDQGTAEDVTTTAADFTISSDNADVIVFQTDQENIFTQSGTFDKMKFKEEGTATLTIRFNGDKDNASFEKTLAVKVEKKTYTVSLDDGDVDTQNWSGNVNDAQTDVTLPIKKLDGGEKVTLKYNGRLKVKSVTAVSDIVPVDPKKTALTIEAITDGTITVSYPMEGMKYSTDGGKTKTAMTATTEIPVQAGQKVQFYGTASSYYGTKIIGSGEGFQCKVYGNIMSLISETDFATATTLTETMALSRLFNGNTTLTDASGLLLPAMTLSRSCYEAMFLGCSNLTAAPELPAEIMVQACYMQMFMNCTKLETAPELKSEQLATSCYSTMFYNCSSLTTAPVLPAATLPGYCYSQMFQMCSKLGSVTCLATNITATGCTNGWLTNAGTDESAERKLHIKSGQNTTDSNWQLSSSGEDGKRWTAVADAQ